MSGSWAKKLNKSLFITEFYSNGYHWKWWIFCLLVYTDQCCLSPESCKLARCPVFQSKTGYEVKCRHHCRKYNSLAVQVKSNYFRVTSEFIFWEPRCKTAVQFVLLLCVPFFLSSFPEQFLFLIFILFLTSASGPQLQIWTENLWSFVGVCSLGMFWLHLVTFFQWQLR